MRPVNTTTSTVNITVDNAKPTVSLPAPGGGAPVSATVTLNATASDNVGVTDVKFYVDNSTTALGTRFDVAVQRIVEHHHSHQWRPHGEGAGP